MVRGGSDAGNAGFGDEGWLEIAEAGFAAPTMGEVGINGGIGGGTAGRGFGWAIVGCWKVAAGETGGSWGAGFGASSRDSIIGSGQSNAAVAREGATFNENERAAVLSGRSHTFASAKQHHPQLAAR
jgi:hypothetical protein